MSRNTYLHEPIPLAHLHRFYFLSGLTGTEQGLDEIISCPEVLISLISLMNDSANVISKDASFCLVNISAVDKGATALINLNVREYMLPLQQLPRNIIHDVIYNILNPESDLADQCCMIFSNLSRFTHLIEQIVDFIEESGQYLDELINVFTKVNYNNTGAKLHYLGPVLSNLSQSHRVRMFILDRTKCVLQRLLPFTEYNHSILRRGGIIATLKNCCFEEYFHEWLLSEEVDILPRLLLPLAGNEEFNDEDNEMLPIELQYLPEGKLREEDPDIRYILVETLTQLATLRSNRVQIRNKNTYIILRELHKWEKDKKVLIACENLINLLIRYVNQMG